MMYGLVLDCTTLGWLSDYCVHLSCGRIWVRVPTITKTIIEMIQTGYLHGSGKEFDSVPFCITVQVVCETVYGVPWDQM